MVRTLLITKTVLLFDKLMDGSLPRHDVEVVVTATIIVVKTVKTNALEKTMVRKEEEHPPIHPVGSW